MKRWIPNGIVYALEVELEDEGDEYDDSKDHTKCTECKGTGWYEGLGVRERCKACDGSGWV